MWLSHVAMWLFFPLPTSSHFPLPTITAMWLFFPLCFIEVLLLALCPCFLTLLGRKDTSGLLGSKDERLEAGEGERLHLPPSLDRAALGAVSAISLRTRSSSWAWDCRTNPCCPAAVGWLEPALFSIIWYGCTLYRPPVVMPGISCLEGQKTQRLVFFPSCPNSLRGGEGAVLSQRPKTRG